MTKNIKNYKEYLKSEVVSGLNEEKSESSGSREESINSSVQAGVLEKIVRVLNHLLRSRQETVSIRKLVGSYARLHGEELCSIVLGFETSEDLMLYLVNQKKWITPVGDDDQFLITTAVLEEVGEGNILISLQREERRVTMDAVTVDEVAESNRIGTSLKVGQSFLAEVTQVDSIEDLWVCCQGNFSERNELMKELKAFYKLPDIKKRYKVFEKSHCQTGRWMAAKYKDQGMHRVLVKKVLSKQSIKVQYIDYGTSETISLKNLYFLSKKFLAWPIMAAHVSMRDDMRASTNQGLVTGWVVGGEVSARKEAGRPGETVRSLFWRRGRGCRSGGGL